MRIFVLLSRIPYPLEKGDKLRAFHQVKALSKNNEIILCALNPIKKTDKQKAFAQLQPYCRSVTFIDLPFLQRVFNIFKAYFKGLPLQVGYFYNRKAARKIHRLIREYQPDHLYGQLTRTAIYLMDEPIRKTLDYQDAFSHGLKRRAQTASFFIKPVLLLEHQRLAAFEKNIFDRFDGKTIISEQDQQLIPHPQKGEIKVIRNGVDMAYFSPYQTEKKQEIVFTGNMNYPPNIDAAVFLVSEIMPLVWKKFPETRLLLAGAHPHPRVRQLASGKVEVSGWMDDIREAYATSQIFIAPMRLGTGLQNKLLEAMAMHIPTVTTPLASAALHAQNGKEILAGNNAQELANHLISLLKDINLRNKIADQALDFVQKNFNWEKATANLETVLKHK